jgi:NADH:ubiquinone oxidoreductase subunit F (NADH-binding)
LWQKPTLINNVETFANVPQILARGVEWYKTGGLHGSRGLKFVGLSGHVARPGVFEVPMGTPMCEVIYQHAGGIRGGRMLKAFAPSGPSSGYLPASMLDVRLDFKALAEAGSMLGSGAIVVCDDTTCMLDMALTGRETMVPPKFATACAGCHLLTFDKRFDVGVPHDKPEVVPRSC